MDEVKKLTAVFAAMFANVFIILTVATVKWTQLKLQKEKKIKHIFVKHFVANKIY